MSAFDSLQCSCEARLSDEGHPFGEYSFLVRHRVLKTIVRCANDNWEDFEAHYEADPEIAKTVLAKAIEDQMNHEYGSIVALILITVLLAAISAVVQYLVKRWLERHPRHMNFAELEGAN